MSVKISIVTICFNSVNTIYNTFASVRNQLYDNIEYIVVDGGSTDGTVELIKQNSDIISKWVSEKDKGISDAFNKGIKMSTGEWILLLNSDDEILSDTVTYVVSHIDSSADIIHGNMIIRNLDGNYVEKKPILDYKYVMKYGMCIFHPGMFIRKSAYDKYGLYDLSYKGGMDRELLARMISKGAKLQYINKALTIFSSGGVSTKLFFKYILPEGFRTSLRYNANIFILLLREIRVIIPLLLSYLKQQIFVYYKK